MTYLSAIKTVLIHYWVAGRRDCMLTWQLAEPTNSHLHLMVCMVLANILLGRGILLPGYTQAWTTCTSQLQCMLSTPWFLIRCGGLQVTWHFCAVEVDEKALHSTMLRGLLHYSAPSHRHCQRPTARGAHA